MFSKSTLSKNSFRNAIRVSNSLDLDQAQHFVGPDQGPNCLQRLSADETSRQTVKQTFFSTHLTFYKIICCSIYNVTLPISTHKLGFY